MRSGIYHGARTGFFIMVPCFPLCSDPALLRQMQESSFYDLNILDDGRLCPCASSDDRHLTRTRCRVHRLAILVLENLDSAEFLYV